MVQPIFKISRGQKIYLILWTVKMGGNYTIKKYLWNGQRYYNILHKKTIYKEAHYDYQKFYYKFQEWKNHNWFDTNTIMMYYHWSPKTLKCCNKH